MAHPSHQTVRLGRGRHSSPADGACVMELASMLAGEPFSDRPKAVCPVIGGFLRTYNDGIDDDRRQDLYVYAARAVGTRGARDTRARRRRACLEAAPGGRRLFAGRTAAGQAAARTFLVPGGTRHDEALAFLDRLIDLPAPEAVDDDTALREAAENLARLDSR